jgi:hypothetical protein
MDVDKGHKGVSDTRRERTTSLIMLITEIAQYFEPDRYLTLILLTWRIWWPNDASRRQMGFKSAFKGLTDVTSFSAVYTQNSYVPFPTLKHEFYIYKGF